MKRYILSTIILSFCIYTTYSQQIIKITSSIETYPQGKGFFYTLPENYLIVTVKMSKTSKYKGPFSEYSEKMLDLSGVIKENTTHYTIEEIELSVKNRPDLSNIYFVEFPVSSKKQNDSLLYKFQQSGLLFDGNTTMSQNVSKEMQVKFSNPNQEQQAQFEMYDNYTMYEKIDTVYETLVQDSVTILVPKVHKRMVEKTTTQRAEETLEALEKIREAQWVLLTGDQEVDFTNLKYMISELKKQEQTYLSLFTGFSITEESVFTFYIELPQKANELIIPLFSFSKETGIEQKEGGEADDDDDDTYHLKLTNTQQTSSISTFLANLEKNRKKEMKNGFYYRIPEFYNISIYTNDVEVKNLGIIPINQYGIIESLPENVKDFEMDKNTGNVKNIRF